MKKYERDQEKKSENSVIRLCLWYYRNTEHNSMAWVRLLFRNSASFSPSLDGKSVFLHCISTQLILTRWTWRFARSKPRPWGSSCVFSRPPWDLPFPFTGTFPIKCTGPRSWERMKQTWSESVAEAHVQLIMPRPVKCPYPTQLPYRHRGEKWIVCHWILKLVFYQKLSDTPLESHF